MTTFLLVRHAEAAVPPDTIAGRQPGVPLSARGRAQAAHLARRLAELSLHAIYTSSVDRAMQTAEPVAAAHGLPLRVCEGLQEVDYGDWTGMQMADLAGDPVWQAWNSHRSVTTIPHGESIVAVQQRVAAAMTRLRDAHPEQNVVLVSHADVIRTAVAHYLGVPLDLSLRIEVTKASVTVVVDSGDGVAVRTVNSCDGLLDCLL